MQLLKLKVFIVFFILSVFVCAGDYNEGFDAAFDSKNGKIYFFKGDNYWRYDRKSRKVDKGFPRQIKQDWNGLWQYDIDAAYEHDKNIVYFFKGDKVIKFDLTKMKKYSGYPKSIKDEFSLTNGWYDNFDTAMKMWNDTVYFFKGKEYVRVNLEKMKMDKGYPASTSAWKGNFKENINAGAFWEEREAAYFFKGENYNKFSRKNNKSESGYPKNIDHGEITNRNFYNEDFDAALEVENGAIYFFKDDLYWKLNQTTLLPYNGYPAKITAWKGLWKDGNIDAAVYKSKGIYYFFKGDECIKYDWKNSRAFPGYPKKISGYWPGVWKDGVDAAVNIKNGNIYFFKGDEYIRYNISKNKVDKGYPLKIKAWDNIYKNDVDAVFYHEITDLALFIKGNKFRGYKTKKGKKRRWRRQNQKI